MTIPKIISRNIASVFTRATNCPPGSCSRWPFWAAPTWGKSSLINVLLGRRKLVRTSAHPGCTRALNFFLVNERWYFVDLPGFGYAAVSKEIQAHWGQMIMDYLERRQNLVAVVLLQDGRRRVGPEELFLWEFLKERRRAVIPVLTKADKLKQGERSRQLQHLAEVLGPLGVAAGEVIWFSALTHEGRERLWARLLECLGGV